MFPAALPFKACLLFEEVVTCWLALGAAREGSAKSYWPLALSVFRIPGAFEEPPNGEGISMLTFL